jgi:hypothetical protein
VDGGRTPAPPGTRARIGCAAAGSLSYLAAAALGLFFVRGAIGAVLLTSLGVISLATGIAALLGPRLRGRAGAASPAGRPWVTAMGLALVALGLVLGTIGVIDIVSWAADR